MYDCSMCIVEKEVKLCKNIAKFLQNFCLFRHEKLCILDAKFQFFFRKKWRGQIYGSLERKPASKSEGAVFNRYE